jgi:hypothetical protein
MVARYSRHHQELTMAATHIDPFAPGDSPQHPANWRPDQGEHFTPEAVQQSVELAQRIHDLRVKHVLPGEIERNAPIIMEELERREALVQEYLAGRSSPAALNSPLEVFVYDEGTAYRWDEAHGWVPVPAAQDDAGDQGPAADTQAPQEQTEGAQEGEDQMAAALAALDAIQGK